MLELHHAPTEAATVCRPPIVPGWPVLGSSFPLLNEPLAFFLASYRSHGPVFRVVTPLRRYVVLAGPQANRFLVSGAEQYLDNKPIYRHVKQQLKTKNYAIATDGEQHRHLRRTLKAAFTHEALEQYAPRMLATADGIVRSWRPGQRFLVPHMMHRLVGEQLGQAMANVSVGEMLATAVTYARFSVGVGLGSYPVVMQAAPHYQLAKRRMQGFMQQVLDDHRAHPKGDRPADFVDLLLQATDHEGHPFDDHDLIANAQMVISNTLLYGAPACAFALYALLKYPEVLAKVRPEVEAFFSGSQRDLAAIQQMRYLRGVMLESMRMFPIALATPRLVKAPFQFAGYDLEPGDSTLFAVSVCHFLEEAFPNPEQFMPERFIGPRDAGRPAGMFVPFGLGSHACIGVNVVELLVMTTLATIIHQTDLTLDRPDYTLRRVVNPFPEPERTFAARILNKGH